ncbi:Uma2 family endonuclease [Aerosakkonemataceae cyanobacterium BLCC-F154]|uniref:Uma2 family endonuclease n=1 Tax=Floridaenema fluviatile BLCC-F154 TaxID=3153640 RepID=A0ABV4YDI8_9CYAN
MQQIQREIAIDNWIKTSWDEYIKILDNPDYQRAKSYYHNGKMRIEMPPIGNDHASDHTIIIAVVTLFAATNGITLNGKDNCTYRKTGIQDVQPDVSYYIGENANIVPYGTSIIDLDIYPPPTLVIEVANTSLADDKGEKRLIYEDLKVTEYWIVDVPNVQVIAFLIENNGSRRITQSHVLPGLEISLLNEAFRRTRQMDQGQVYSWLLTQFQQK